MPTIPGPAQVGAGQLPFRVYNTDYSPARGCHSESIILTTVRHGLQSGTLRRSVVGPAVLTIPGPLMSEPGGCLSESGTDYSPAGSDGPWLVSPCSPSPGPLKSAPGGCLSESGTVYSPARSDGPWLVPPCPPFQVRSSRRRAAAFPSLLRTTVRHAPTVRGWSRRAHHPLALLKWAPGSCLSESILLTTIRQAPTVRGWSRRAHHPRSAQVRAGQLPFRVHYGSQSGTPRRSVVGPAVLSFSGTLKSAPSCCLFDSVTDYGLAHFDNLSRCRTRRAPHPLPARVDTKQLHDTLTRCATRIQ